MPSEHNDLEAAPAAAAAGNTDDLDSELDLSELSSLSSVAGPLSADDIDLDLLGV